MSSLLQSRSSHPILAIHASLFTTHPWSSPFLAEEFGLLPSRAVELLKNAAFQDLTPLPSPECYENCKNQALTPSTPMSRGSFMLR